MKNSWIFPFSFILEARLRPTASCFHLFSRVWKTWWNLALVLSSVFSCLENLMKPRTRFWNSTWNWAFKSCSLVWVKLKDTLKSNIIKHYLRLCSEGWSSIKKFAEIEICNEIVDIFMLDMSSKHIFYPKTSCEHVWGVSKFSLPVLKTSETLHFHQYLEVKLLSTYFLLLYH